MIRLISFARRCPYVIVGFLGIIFIVMLLKSDFVVCTVPAGRLFTWQVLSGLLLTVLLLYQWLLLFARVYGKNARSYYKAHRWVGVSCTGVFAFHALSFGYSWTNTLAIVFCLSTATGLLNREIMNYRKPWIYKLWYLFHVTLTMSLAPLISVHIWVALAYEGL